MNSLFLQNLTLQNNDLIVAIAGLVVAFLALFLILISILYVYTSLAYFAIARKARLKSPGIAWIPAFGPLIIAYKTSKMHWWPWLLIIGYFIPFINIFATLAFCVFSVIWHWKMFESIKRPGWWSILLLIPLVGLVMLGVAAWSKK